MEEYQSMCISWVWCGYVCYLTDVDYRYKISNTTPRKTQMMRLNETPKVTPDRVTGTPKSGSSSAAGTSTAAVGSTQGEPTYSEQSALVTGNDVW